MKYPKELLKKLYDKPRIKRPEAEIVLRECYNQGFKDGEERANKLIKKCNE